MHIVTTSTRCARVMYNCDFNILLKEKYISSVCGVFGVVFRVFPLTFVLFVAVCAYQGSNLLGFSAFGT